MVNRRDALTPYHYILEGHTPVVEPDLMTWARWFEAADRQVARTEHELFTVSTVFLGLDHQYGKGPPILFETMVFDEGLLDGGECVRYATWEDAEIGHEAMVRRMLEMASASNVR